MSIQSCRRAFTAFGSFSAVPKPAGDVKLVGLYFRNMNTATYVSRVQRMS